MSLELDHNAHTAVARSRLHAYTTGEPVQPLTSTCKENTLENAHAIQLLQIGILQMVGALAGSGVR